MMMSLDKMRKSSCDKKRDDQENFIYKSSCGINEGFDSNNTNNNIISTVQWLYIIFAIIMYILIFSIYFYIWIHRNKNDANESYQLIAMFLIFLLGSCSFCIPLTYTIMN